MKISRLTSMLILAAACGSGAAMAQQNAPTTPSTTPNDTTATPPNNDKVPPGTPAPAPYASQPSGTAPVNRDTSGSDLRKEKEPRLPSDMKNTNVSPTQGGGAPYTDTGKR
ncbi:hypothetical protein CAL12_17650 [Bordetella genomosp. 8]|uniref:Lipoprotein n=1 Tax=Bordetella genomosp. 8 TaxID=1416806 RepID=A0A1W6YN57_9BORD|nr:hypothetical protein [Bordetella genomosp. 8]ARP82461.1 hypothetical protein CAL12_17650 [Bordetella genomosp. 8]